MRESCGNRCGRGIPSRGGGGGTGRTATRKPNERDLVSLRIQYESLAQRALAARNQFRAADHQLEVAKATRAIELGASGVLPPPPPPDPQPLWMWPGVQDVPHWGEITCACCVNRATQIGVALLDPVRCFCAEPLGVPVRPTPLRKKMMLEAEMGLVAKREVQFEEQTVVCIDKMQHLQSGNRAFLEEVTSSTQQFRNAILLNKWQPARLKMTAPLVRRSRAGEKSLTLRATAREYKKIRVGDWQMLRCQTKNPNVVDMVEYTKIVRGYTWAQIRRSAVLRTMVIAGEGAANIDEVENTLKDLMKRDNIDHIVFDIFCYRHHRVFTD